MGMNKEQLVQVNSQLAKKNSSLESENTTLQEAIEELRRSNSFKKFVLLGSLGVSTFSLGLAIWSNIEKDRPGLSEAGAVFAVLSLTIALLGLLKDCACKHPPTAPSLTTESETPALGV